MAEEPQTTDPMVAALLREREGYVLRGMKERAAQVDEQLKLRGYKPPAKKAAPVKKTTEDEQRVQPPQGRTPQAPETT